MLGMAAETPNRQPGDLILNRYMPRATAEERDAARGNLRAFAVVIVGIAKRLALEAQDHAIDVPGHHTIDFEERPLPHP